MVKVEKEIVIYTAPYKPIKLRVTDADSFAEANEVLRTEFSKYSDLIADDDREIINKILEDEEK